jgi:uncharacterized protein
MTSLIALTSRRCIMANPFVHLELHTRDVDKSKKFALRCSTGNLKKYGHELHYDKCGRRIGGGMMKNPMPDDPDNWLPYILVDDVAASSKKAKSLGATIARQVTEVPDMGWFSVIVDRPVPHLDSGS